VFQISYECRFGYWDFPTACLIGNAALAVTGICVIGSAVLGMTGFSNRVFNRECRCGCDWDFPTRECRFGYDWDFPTAFPIHTKLIPVAILAQTRQKDFPFRIIII